MGIGWATSTIGFVALALAPTSFLFFRYGKRIRQRSEFAPCIVSALLPPPVSPCPPRAHQDLKIAKQRTEERAIERTRESREGHGAEAVAPNVQPEP